MKLDVKLNIEKANFYTGNQITFSVMIQEKLLISNC